MGTAFLVIGAATVSRWICELLFKIDDTKKARA